MICTLNKSQLADYVSGQLNNICPDLNRVTAGSLMPFMDEALDRQEECFRHCILPGYRRDGEVYFDHLHTDKYITFLYFLANAVWKGQGDVSISSKIMNLIRIISGMFLSFKCELPEHFIFFHAVGSVIGNARYGDYFMVLQNVTINDCEVNKTPELGRGVYLATGAKIIGDKKIGNRVSVGVNALVYNTDIPDDSVVMSKNNTIEIRKRKHENCFIQRYYDIKI